MGLRSFFLLYFNAVDLVDLLNFLAQLIPLRRFTLISRRSVATMSNEDKKLDADVERQEHRISLEKDAAKLDTVPGADAAQKALFVEFANKDEVWKKQMDKKLVRKIDVRLLPVLVVLYLLNFLDRSVVSSLHYFKDLLLTSC